MTLVTSQGYDLVPDISPIAQRIGQALQLRQAQEKKDELAVRKQQAETLKQAAQTAGVNALRIRNIDDPITKRKEIAILARETLEAGGDAQPFADLLAIQNPDELNVRLQKIAMNAGNQQKLLEQGLKAEFGDVGDIPAGQAEFENLIRGMSPEDRERARRIKAGLDPRATGSADITISEREGLAEKVGEAKAKIKEREKFGELTGASRAKKIDEGFTRVSQLQEGIGNIDSAIQAIDEGAQSGPLISRFTPTIRSQTKRLEQVRNLMALDVLNSATFGALSENELRIVQQTAMPDLPPKELREWLEVRKSGMRKLQDSIKEQIDFLDQGGTQAGFLRMKEREKATTPPPSGGVKFLGFE